MDTFDPGLGVGISMKDGFYHHFRDALPKPLTWVEIITENYIPWESAPLLAMEEKLRGLRQISPVAFHGVSLSLGSEIDISFVNRLKKFADHFDPLWISDHLCWSSSPTHHLHDLYPLPYSEESLARVTQNIHRVQDILKRPLVIENVSAYVSLPPHEMQEWEFIDELVKRSGCQLLLDINNVFVNAFNFGFQAKEYLRHIPSRAVIEIHLAGHEDCGDYLFDTHGESIKDSVWDLYEWYVEQYGFRPTLLERDSNIPEWSEIERELNIIERVRLNHVESIAERSAAVL